MFVHCVLLECSILLFCFVFYFYFFNFFFYFIFIYLFIIFLRYWPQLTAQGPGPIDNLEEFLKSNMLQDHLKSIKQACSCGSVHFKYGPEAHLTYKILAD